VPAACAVATSAAFRRAVASRDRARPKLDIERERREAFLAVLQLQEHVTATPWRNGTPPDSDDTSFLEVALQTVPRILVTGNLRHLPLTCRRPVTVLPPRTA
jgi:predicted nucleic acid-binding protein